MNKTLLVIVAVVITSTWQMGHSAFASAPKYEKGQLIAKFKADLNVSEIRKTLDQRLFQLDQELVQGSGLYRVKLATEESPVSMLRRLRTNRSVVYAQLDHLVTRRERVPNDPKLADQWHLKNAKTQVDIRAPQAWELGTGGKNAQGQDIVVAIVDGGVDVAHSDLRENIWVNRAEIAGNGKDDDGNGYIDDVNGWSSNTNSGNIKPDMHGTHVAGITGARGDNGVGVVGVNWQVKIMAIDGINRNTSQVVAGYGYALAQKKLWLESRGEKGANVVVTNSSFGVDRANCNSGSFPVWNDMYNQMGQAGILSAAATANANLNIDVEGDVPTGCDSDFIVSVTNTQENDTKYPQAGYGKLTIDLGAPGTRIVSTLPSGKFGSLTGTSMATPVVAGSIAFLHSMASKALQRLKFSSPAEQALAIKKLLLANVEPNPDLAAVTVSGGRVNLERAAHAAAAHDGRYSRRRQ